MFENKYPYTDFHELNLDWFLARFKELSNEFIELKESNDEFKSTMTENFNTLSSTVQTFTDFVTNYFDNLDVQHEINVKLDEMYLNGDLENLMKPYFEKSIYWVTPENYGAVGDGVADDTQAIADALAAGQLVVFTKGKTYKTTSTINITGGKCIDCQGNIVSTANYVFDISGNFNIIKIDGTVTCKNFVSCSANTAFNDIKYSAVYISGVYGFNIDASAGTSFSHNRIEGERISGSPSSEPATYGYYLKCAGSGYINENTFGKTSLYKMTTAIYFENDDSATNSCNNNIFDNIDPEESDVGIHLKGKLIKNHFYNIRNNEFDALTFVKLEGSNCAFNDIHASRWIKTSTIDCTSPGKNILYGDISDRNGTIYWFGPVYVMYDTALAIWPMYKIQDKVLKISSSIYFDLANPGSQQYHSYNIFDVDNSGQIIIGLDNSYGHGKIGSIKAIVHAGGVYPRVNINGTQVWRNNATAANDCVVTINFLSDGTACVEAVNTIA